jgi:hypothetical protein
VNRDTRHQGGAPGHEPVAAASASARQGRRTDMGMQNSHARDHPDTPASPAICDSNETLTRPRQRAPPADRPQPSRSPDPERIKRLLRAKQCRMCKGANHGGTARKAG